MRLTDEQLMNLDPRELLDAVRRNAANALEALEDESEGRMRDNVLAVERDAQLVAALVRAW